MKVVNFEFEKDKKEYGVNSLLKDVEKIHKEDGIEMIVVVFKKKSGAVGYGTNYGNTAEFIGLLEIGKTNLIDELNE